MSLKKILTLGCIIYTILITAVYTFGLLFNDTGLWIPTLRIAYSLLGFSMGASAVYVLLDGLRLPFDGKLPLHFIATALLYYLIFVIGGGFSENGSSVLAAMLIFLAIYALGAIIVLVMRWLLKDNGEQKKKTNKKNDTSDNYQSIFKSK